MKFQGGDRVVISEKCSFQSGSKGKVTEYNPNMEAFDYVVRLDNEMSMYEFTKDEIEKIEGCDNLDHELMYSSRRGRWICPFCEE